MLLHLGFLATSTPTNWQPILDRLAARTAEYRHLMTGGKATGKRAQKWIDSSGISVQVAGDGATVAKHPGALIVLLKRAGLSDPCCLALFQTDGAKVRSTILEEQSFFFGSCIPDNAAKVGPNLVVSGLRHFRDRPAMAVVYSFAPSAGKWRQTGKAATGFRTEGAVRLRFDKAGQLQPVDAFNLTTPPHIQANFGDSFYMIQHRWTFANGVVKEAWARPADTPYTHLDTLMGYLDKGDAEGVRKLCRDDQVFKSIWALRSRIDDGTRHAVVPGDADPNKSKTLGLDNLRTYFHFTRYQGHWVISSLSPLDL